MKKYLRISIGIITGGISGFVYYYYFGCHSGCGLKSSPYIMVLYGTLFGLILGMPSKSKKK